MHSIFFIIDGGALFIQSMKINIKGVGLLIII